MKKIFAVTAKVILQILREPRTIALLFFAHALIAALLYVTLETDLNLNVGLYQPPKGVAQKLADTVEVKKIDSLNEGKNKLKVKDIDILVDFSDENHPIFWSSGTSVSRSKVATGLVTKILLEIRSDSAKAKMERAKLQQEDLQNSLVSLKEKMDLLNQRHAQPLPFQVFVNKDLLDKPSNGPDELNMIDYEEMFLYNTEAFSSFDVMAPHLLGFIIFFLVFIISGMAFLKERSSGTLERVSVAPVSSAHIVLGYLIGFGILAIVQSLLVEWYMYGILDIKHNGSLISASVVCMIGAILALSFGLMLSAFAKSEFQMMQFIPIVISPQVFLGGMFDLSDVHSSILVLSELFPLTHIGRTLENILIKGKTLKDELATIGILTGYIFAFVGINIFSLKKPNGF